ncbi:MAG: hypothetical protein U0790_21460 [Isosphaeraceae bacterium]
MTGSRPGMTPRPKAPVKIKWSLVCMTYQPTLAAGWSACTNTFREGGEARPGLRGEPLLGRHARTIDCFY